jgi:cystathionine beta-lyase
MAYDFNTMLNRHGFDSIAVDMMENDFWEIPKGKTDPKFDQIPMWIADMNFATADTITEELMKRAAHPSFGYFIPSDDYFNAIIRWQKEGNGVTGLTKECIGYENGVLGGITSAMRVFFSARSCIALIPGLQLCQ